MAELAILGHKTRGKEVIEILEMLGGTNVRNYKADYDSLCFYISKITSIIYYGWANSCYDNLTVFTLEEFLEKYPYKVGDRVKTIYGKIGIVSKPIWSNRDNCIRYELEADTDSFYFINELQPYKEETMEGKTDTAKAINLIGEDYSGKRFVYKIPNGYEFDCLKNNEIILKPKQPQYPKTYVKCCDILNVDPYSKSAGYKSGLITAFRNLLICRDAYWKIAGEQMGLGKPWEPDYLNPTKEIRYFIFCTGISIEKGQGLFPTNKILIFPTEEMRDAFYENFKELIELCKELL